MSPAEPGPARGGADERLRLFIAVLPPKAVLAALAEAQAALELSLRATEKASHPRWVRPEGIHLTLRFLGDTPAEGIPAIERAMAAVAATTSPHVLRLGDLGTFGGRRPRVVWAGLSGAVAELQACALALAGALAQAGLAEDPRGWRPHLTLARAPARAGRAQREALRAAVADAPSLPPLPIPIRELHLIRSVLGPGGARYSTLAVVKFTARP